MVNGQWSMVNDKISQLIERFLNAQTTEAEEQTLAEYFQSAESVPEEWQPYRELFLSFQTDAYELTDSELAALTAEPAVPRHKVIKMYWLYAAAACAAILFIIGSGVLWKDAKHQNIAKTETEHKQTTYPLAAPAGTPPNLGGESVATTPANQIAEAKPVSKRKIILGTSTNIEEEPPTDKIVYEENDAPIPNLLAANTEPEPTEPEPQMVVYSETDMPITNPQNLLYTEEDIQKLHALYKQRLIAEIQNDVEISRHNLRRLEQFLASN